MCKTYGFGPENVGYIRNYSHLIGIMISKTIGYNGVHNIFRHTDMESRCVVFHDEFHEDQTGVGKCPMTWGYWTSPKIVAI